MDTPNNDAEDTGATVPIEVSRQTYDQLIRTIANEPGGPGLLVDGGKMAVRSRIERILLEWVDEREREGPLQGSDKSFTQSAGPSGTRQHNNIDDDEDDESELEDFPPEEPPIVDVGDDSPGDDASAPSSGNGSTKRSYRSSDAHPGFEHLGGQRISELIPREVQDVYGGHGPQLDFIYDRLLDKVRGATAYGLIEETKYEESSIRNAIGVLLQSGAVEKNGWLKGHEGTSFTRATRYLGVEDITPEEIKENCREFLEAV